MESWHVIRVGGANILGVTKCDRTSKVGIVLSADAAELPADSCLGPAVSMAANDTCSNDHDGTLSPPRSDRRCSQAPSATASATSTLPPGQLGSFIRVHCLHFATPSGSGAEAVWKCSSPFRFKHLHLVSSNAAAVYDETVLPRSGQLVEGIVTLPALAFHARALPASAAFACSAAVAASRASRDASPTTQGVLAAVGVLVDKTSRHAAGESQCTPITIFAILTLQVNSLLEVLESCLTAVMR